MYGRTERGEKAGAPEAINGFVRIQGPYVSMAMRATEANRKQDKDPRGRHYTFFPSPVKESEVVSK
jgi:hypothetical protein